MSFAAGTRIFAGEFTVKGLVDQVFSLFSPIGEKCWVPQWEPELLHPAGVAWERGLVFRTWEETGDAIWIVTELDRPGHKVEYYRVETSRYVARVEVDCRAFSGAETIVKTIYEFIGLSKVGNDQIATMTEANYKAKMTRWQNWINTYLRELEK
jgi:hypothetical protein